MSQHTAQRTLISFDWAMKSILRDKANFDVLEGFLSTLLGQEITVLSLLESESNQRHEQDKFNRVDLAVIDARGELFLIEIQYDREIAYLKRLLYGAAKLITENLKLGESFAQVCKVISISILYFQLDEEHNDYIYHGYTEFYGWHTKQMLNSANKSHRQRQMERNARAIFPEYYLIDVASFQNIIQSELDEWVYFFKNSEIRADFRAKNIQQAREKLDVLNMNEAERRAYEQYLINRAVQGDVLQAAHLQGQAEGRVEGESIGERNKALAIARTMKQQGFALALIAQLTALTEAEIEAVTI